MKKKEAIAHQTLKGRQLRGTRSESSVRTSPRSARPGGVQNNSHDVSPRRISLGDRTLMLVKKMTEDESQRLLHMEELLHARRGPG